LKIRGSLKPPRWIYSTLKSVTTGKHLLERQEVLLEKDKRIIIKDVTGINNVCYSVYIVVLDNKYMLVTNGKSTLRSRG
jgi:hypothetical protein